MSAALDLFTVVAVVAGAFFFLAGTVGLLPQANGLLAGLKLFAIWLLTLLVGAAVSQLIARAARRAGPRA